MKHLFLLSVMLLPLSAIAGVGDTDNRYYVTDEMWAQEPYKKFVLLYAGISYDDGDGQRFIKLGHCSAQYISPNLILSAGHCIYTQTDFLETLNQYRLDPNNFSRNYQITDYNQNTFYVKLIDTEYDGTVVMPGDWAVWLVTDPQYYSDAYFDVKTSTKTIDVINAGWGFARIISEHEIDNVRKIYNEIKNMIEEQNKVSEASYKKSTTISSLSDYIDEKCELYGMEKFSEETDRLKASECKIVFEDCRDIAHDVEYFKYQGKKLKSDKKQKKLQNICNNQTGLLKKREYPNMLATTCDTWQGNSGGGYISLDGRYVYGIVSGGASSFEDDTNTNYATSAIQFEKRIKDLIKKYDSKNSVEDNIAKIPTNLYGDIADISTDSENSNVSQDGKERQIRWSNGNTDLEELGKQIINDVSNNTDITDEQLLAFFDKVAEYKVKNSRLEKLQKAYEEAKAKEQSATNKLLGAATMMATGIGGMQLASGLAEQAADQAAEDEMRAYLSTFTCKYGDKRVAGGTKNVEIPGGNELIGLYAEYVNLANDLKARKTALGIKPGVESEPILDSATAGLHDDENMGKRGGMFISLSRALQDPTGEDAQKWRAQQEESAKKVKDGTTYAGVGAIGGSVGNLIINSDKK